MARVIRKAKKNDTAGTSHPGKTIGRAALIGFFGGLIWSLTGLVCNLLNFTSIGPSLVFSPFTQASWKNHPGGQLLAIFVISVLSVPIALVYQLILGRIKFIWTGIVYGIVMWLIVFFVFQPWIPGLPYLTRLGLNNLITTLCLYVLYGLFIGYSITFVMNDETNSENYSNE
ncbi:hypothetical protein EWI07_09900 [Sporolactobacillus sp. THM7-4]|nr:hypothetical protein EWI07_09900 [Sporolactobacillus sp. THM7-4]